jgi:sugar phosphate isomerase/epimerase
MTTWKYALSSAKTAPPNAPILLTGDFYDNLNTAADWGFDGLEVHMREDTVPDYERVRRIMEERHISIAAIITGRLNTQGQVNLIDDRPYITGAAMKGMGEYIQLAANLKTNLVIGWIKGRIPEGAGPHEYLARLGRNLKRICTDAAGANVKIFVEVINRYEVNVFTTARETLDFITAWDIPNCYVHLDTFHMNIEERSPAEAIRLCGNKLGYFHVADNTRLYPGSGALDFKNYYSALRETGYEGFISVECLPWPDGKTAAERALRFLKQCEAHI